MAEPISVAITVAPKVDLTDLPDKFSGQSFKRWQQRRKIWLTMKGLLTVIQVTRPELTDTVPKTAEIAQWTKRDQIGRGAILSALSNTLFDVYCSESYTAKSLWDELDRKYNTEEQGLKKYSVSKFMRYQIVEDRFVAEQTHEIIKLDHALADAEMKLPEKFLVMSIVDKFPKSWENFGMTLKHQKGRLSLDDLMIAISIEEEHRNQTHKMPIEHQPRANLIVGKQRVNKINSNSKAINKGKTTKNKKPKANKPCWNCGQVITGKTVSMGNSSTAEILGIGSVDLKFPSKHILSLKRVHHVPTVKRNIISGSVIVGEGYELAFKFNKVVIQQFETPPYSPSSNGVAKRKNRTFKDMINSLLLTSGLPKYLWGEALNTACHILNRVSLKHNTSTPFELWKGIEVNTIVEFRDAIFLEDVFPMKTRIPSSVSLDDSLISTSIPEHVEKMTNVGVNPNSTSLTHEESDIRRRSKRARVVKNFGSDFVTYNIEDDPVTFKDAMASLEAKQWKEAVKSEMDSIVSNGTWVLVDLPLGCTTIGSSVYNLLIHQMDMKTTFLYGELEEEIYMDQPEGFVAHGSCIKIKLKPKSFLKNKFEMKDMGEADVILGIKLIRSTDGITISQSHYVEKIIEKFGYHDSRIAKTPYDSSVALFKNESGVSVAQLRVLRYLTGIVSLAIHYGRFPAVLEGYSDASWIAKNSGMGVQAELCALDTTGTEAE
ncbi:Retrovirus-related Pol polyprotein from transposon TNT 1-94 [Sesamum angolense]|uniref:Retrovirus-related Pol polyprotein from transposon TNT 1-94 n=1 Tax=Sesamum angolense TaxID=2727404 RepID=A0AAE2C0C8_9LAMI|nr:Retrovirus-related Pol polyprotein from transposon TNT 1-94 [Sesamum angolense]